MLKGVFSISILCAGILAISVAVAPSNAFAQHHGGGGHAGGGHTGGGHVGGMGGGSMHHGGSHHGGYGGGYGSNFGGIGIGFGSYGLGGLGYSGFGGYGGLGYSSLALGYGGYGNYGGYSPYSGYGSSYSGYGSYAPRYYSARPIASVYIAPAYSYSQPQTYRVQGYSTQMQAHVQPSAPGSDLRPGMVLPDGAIVTSVGPIQ